jgi:phospholipase/lecithinase/hemolysin
MISPLALRAVRPVAARILLLLLFVGALTRESAAQYTGLYAFGDSLSDLGNTYNALGGSGSDQNIYNVLGYTASPGRYDAGRWSNGPVWVEHLNNHLGLPTLQRNSGMTPLASGTNFAYGGATSGTGYTDFIVANLQTQVSSYVTLAGGTGSPTGLYTVWAGGNDVIDYISDGMPNTPAAIDQHATTMAANIATAVTTLYNTGARHFLVPNLPALGDKPDYVNTPNQAFANSIVTTYNPKLAQALTNLEVQFPEIKLTPWDVYSDFNQMLQNPGNFGFTNVTVGAFSSTGPYPGAVAANPAQHVFWDHTHPTAPGHVLLGHFAYGALIPEPASLALLGVGTVAMVSLRRKHRLVGRYSQSRS